MTGKKFIVSFVTAFFCGGCCMCWNYFSASLYYHPWMTCLRNNLLIGSLVNDLLSSQTEILFVVINCNSIRLFFACYWGVLPLIHLQDVRKTVSSLSQDSSLENDECFVMFVLSHGTVKEINRRNVDCVFGSDGQPVQISDILSPFTNARCPSLRNKPKLMFFQACRGGMKYIRLYAVKVYFDVFTNCKGHLKSISTLLCRSMWWLWSCAW